MPTIIALDVSLSMTRILPNCKDDEQITFHQLAIQGINKFLDYLTFNAKLEYVSLVSFYYKYNLKYINFNLVIVYI